jgi:hypothetical protein
MGSIADLSHTLGVSDKVKTVIDTAETAFSACCAAYGIASTVVGVLSRVFGSGGEEETISEKIDRLLEHFDEMFQVLEAEVLAASELNTREHLQQQLNKARGARDAAVSYAPYAGDPHPPPQTYEAFLKAQGDSKTAADDLAHNYWDRIYTADALYADGWGDCMYPPRDDPGSKFVWDYRLALPAYLEAVLIRLAVILVSETEYREGLGRSDIRNHAIRLTQIYREILKGFQFVRAPKYSELYYLLPCLDDACLWILLDRLGGLVVVHTGEPVDEYQLSIVVAYYHIGQWRLENYVYGAVDSYGAEASTASYPSEEIMQGAASIDIRELAKRLPMTIPGLPSAPPNLPEDFTRFVERLQLRHTLRSRTLAHALYNSLGLDNLRRTILHLYGTLNEKPDDWLEYAPWSVRQAFESMPAWMKSELAPDQPISLRTMSAQLGTTEPLSLQRMLLVEM